MGAGVLMTIGGARRTGGGASGAATCASNKMIMSTLPRPDPGPDTIGPQVAASVKHHLFLREQATSIATPA